MPETAAEHPTACQRWLSAVLVTSEPVLHNARGVVASKNRNRDTAGGMDSNSVPQIARGPEYGDLEILRRQAQKWTRQFLRVDATRYYAKHLQLLSVGSRFAGEALPVLWRIGLDRLLFVGALPALQRSRISWSLIESSFACRFRRPGLTMCLKPQHSIRRHVRCTSIRLRTH